MCLNSVNEEFDRAYANVGLLASNVWTFQKNITDYKKSNLNLWIRFNDVEQHLAENELDYGNSISDEKVTRTVRDTIPLSRLASYNDFVYNEQRERLYCSDDEDSIIQENTFHKEQSNLEVWMLPEVEKEFKRLTSLPRSNWSCVSPRRPTGRELAPVMCVTTASPYQWLTQTAWPNQLISRYPELPKALQHTNRASFFKEEKCIQPNYSPEELEDKLEEFPCPRYLIETNGDLELHTRIDSAAVRQLWASPPAHHGGFSPSFPLNAEVPEFRPVTVRIQQYPSIYNTTYEAELFPYSNMDKLSLYQQPPDEGQTAIFYKEQQVQNIPVFLRPPESYFSTETSKHKWRKSQRCGAVLSNLIPLTGTDGTLMAEPVPSLEQEVAPAYDSPAYYNPSNNKLETTQQMLDYLDKWLSKIYNPSSTDFSSMSTISGTIDKIFLNIQDNYCSAQDNPPPIVESPSAPHRPLYSDVLMNEASPATCSDTKYDELEREALEQYSGSDPALTQDQQAEESEVIVQNGSPGMFPEPHPR